MNKSEGGDSCYESESDEEVPSNMLEWQDKWWLTKRHKTEMLENKSNEKSQGYVCTIIGENDYDGTDTDVKHFRTIVEAYDYVCDYLTRMYNNFGGEDLNLYYPRGYGEENEIVEDSLTDWKDVFFLLNYGSSSGPTYYTITVEPIEFS